MTSRRRRFERMVVGLPQGIGNQPAVEAAADLAEFLHLELLTTFVADATLCALAELPVRELRTLDQGWQAIDVAEITRDIDRATAGARRRFAESVKSLTIKTSFDVITGAQVMATLIRADDIVAIIEPTHPGEMITRQFIGLLDAAFATATAILVVPRRLARTSGPIMAVASGPEDTSIRVALEIAAALRERLIVLARPGVRLPPEILTDAEQLGVRVDEIAAGGTAANAPAPAPAPLSSRSKERLRVVTRSRRPDDAHRLFATLHGVPLLVIEPERAEPAAEQENQQDRSPDER